MVGQTVSHYRIVEKLGGGGIGVVYKAVDTRLNRFVALKFLSADLTKDKDANDRFMQEAQAASALDHPNICTIHEIDETPDGELFLTMAYYDGETLKQRIERGPLPIEAAIDIAVQIAHALSRAHQSGIVHRDIKPANLMIATDGLVKILDFGLAKLGGRSDLTKTGTTVGTVAYMSPEQIRGGDADARADVWALGVVLYQMLAGRRPFEGRDDLAVLSAILDATPAPVGRLREGVPQALQEIVARAMEKNVSARYASATELLKDLTACRTTMTIRRGDQTAALAVLRTPVTALIAAAVLIAAGIPVIAAYRRNARARWAHDEAIPQIKQLIAADKTAAAFDMATDVERTVPNDPGLAELWPQFSARSSIVTLPAGADVYVQPYAATDDRWEHLGRTPVTGVRLPRSVLRFRIEKAGFEPQSLAATNPSSLLQNATNRLAKPITISLVPAGTGRDMVPVPGGAFPVPLSGFSTTDLVSLDPFSIDRFEVSNKAFKQFVDAGGYSKALLWQHLPFAPEGRGGWREAVGHFHDSTDRPGPATWEVGAYASGQDDYPVGGVSWYEAVAYCRSVGKALPTVFHWARAALAPDEMFSPLAPSIIPVSNFAANGPARVGSYRGMSPYGAYDMGGNVREWGWNESNNGRRWVLGGGWNDPDWMLIQRNHLVPSDRSATNGFRCAAFGAAGLPDRVMGPIDNSMRNPLLTRAVSNEVFEVFKRQFAYTKSELNDRVESTNTANTDWTREKLSFEAADERARVPAYLFLPRNVKPPYQLVVFFPGLTAFAGRASSENPQLGLLDFVVKTGRALLWPIYKGSFERWDTFLDVQGDQSLPAMRTRMVEWREEVGRALDVMAARKDIDMQRAAYVGVSFGSSMPLPLLALENRFKVAVLLAPGFTYRPVPPEADAINYVSHVTMPVLMIGGRQDYVLPLEEAQKPLFERLGTPAEHKRHVIFDAGHVADYPRSQTLREVLAWLDRYLGPVGGSTATQK